MRVSCEVELPNLVVPALPAAAPRAVRPTPAKTTEISRNERRVLSSLPNSIQQFVSHNPIPCSRIILSLPATTLQEASW